jgi:hypothetical protein
VIQPATVASVIGVGIRDVAPSVSRSVSGARPLTASTVQSNGAALML